MTDIEDLAAGDGAPKTDTRPTHSGFVALIGPTNAGKSTLVNRFVGAKVSIVSHKVQTTRAVVRGIAIHDNAQIVFMDTPGIFKPRRRLDRAMVTSAWGGAKDADLIMLLIVQMLPQQAMVIALFLDFRSLGLLDNLAGLILVYTAFSIPVTIWMLRSFVAAVPREMEEAAAIDGAGPMRIFWRIMLPLVAPGLVATSVFAFIFAWNEFIFALVIMNRPDSQTLPVWLQAFNEGAKGTDWGGVMAGSTLMAIPVVIFFLLVQRRVASGLTAGAVKG